jgi:hypothetical protein
LENDKSAQLDRALHRIQQLEARVQDLSDAQHTLIQKDKHKSTDIKNLQEIQKRHTTKLEEIDLITTSINEIKTQQSGMNATQAENQILLKTILQQLTLNPNQNTAPETVRIPSPYDDPNHPDVQHNEDSYDYRPQDNYIDEADQDEYESEMDEDDLNNRDTTSHPTNVNSNIAHSSSSESQNKGYWPKFLN